MKSAPISIAARTQRITLLASVLGSLIASLLAAVALDILVAKQADHRLRAATDTLGIELDEEHEENDYDPLDEVLDDENQEIATSGIRLAVYEGTTLLAGNPKAHPVLPGACRTQLGMRSCGKSYGRWLLVAARKDERAHWRELLAAAVGLSIILASVISFLLSRGLARWAAAPLIELASDLGKIDAERSTKRTQPWTSRDVLEVRAIQDAVDTLLERVSFLLISAQRFSRDAAHELLTPLTVVSTKLQLIHETLELSEPVKDDLAKMVQHLARLSKLVDGLLLLAADPESSRNRFEPVSLQESMEEVLRDLQPLERSRVVIQAEAEGLVLGEPNLIRGAIQNGLFNALKFSEDQIVLRLVESEGEIFVHIEDRGPGVPEDLRQRVLEPFFRSAADHTPGHGLGLAIVSHIMSAHRGSVQFAPAERGAHLVLSFPRWKAS